jgi:amino acid adenylation domain-containing protein
MQQGMLFHAVNGGTRGVDVEQVVCELRHPVSPPEFEQACRLIAARHETLRTTFVWPQGQPPRQVVRPAAEVTLPLRVLDFSGTEDIGAIVEQYLEADRRAGFPVLTAPLARIALFLAADDAACFVFTYHHLVLDARGMYTLFKELMEIHDALVRGENLSLPPVRPYQDYIAWLQTLDTRRAEAFWREQFQGLHAPTALPVPPPAGASAADEMPGEMALRFSDAETNRLREAAARHGVTLNTILQGAWAVVLSRYTGEDDVVFGAVRACRHVPVEGAAGMIGMLINTVPLRVRLASAASVGHWLRGLREQWIALRDFEHSPLLEVQRCTELAPGRPLFDTIFNFQEPSWIAALRRLGGIWAQRRFEIRSQPGYPLALDLYGDDGLLVRAFYDRRRFDGPSVGRLLGHFRTAAASLADAHTDRVGEVAMVDAAERRQLLSGFNGTHADYPRDLCVHRAFEEMAAVHPDRVAVVDAKTTLTYGDLNARANCLAARLQGLGIGPDRLVAVCMTRSTEMLVAWLGALKAGGAFVPLDPGYPPERLSFQLQDCRSPVLLTQTHLAGVLPPIPAGVTCLEIGPGAQDIGVDAGANVTSDVAAENLAYVIYTSGSTGQPKGVQIEHRALMNLVTWHQRTYGISPADRATQLASPAFDASVWETWPYLTAGASLHIPDDDTRISPAALWCWMAARKITVAFLPTPLAEAALNETWPEGMTLRALLTGGDQLRRPAPPTFPCALVNHYGPTENTVVATAAIVSASVAGAPPIGAPIANTTACVLDREMRPVPVGVPGELYLGGESLARGYLNRPELTAEKFVANPFAAASAGQSQISNLKFEMRGSAGAAPARLYRTGDLVRWRPDGQLDFLGRIDHQVKIRGCRVELGEIEAALQRHPAVREAVVVTRPDEQGNAQLVGYVVATAAAPAEDELIEFLRAALPSYMVPVAVLALAAWPLTANGKVDRRALPPPPVRSAHPSTQVAPRTEQEQAIARIWADVLGRDPIGVHDNFFEMGGHSLLAAQAITRLNAALGATISVRTLFDHPTVAEFASALERNAAFVAPRPALRAKRRAVSPELELVQPR